MRHTLLFLLLLLLALALRLPHLTDKEQGIDEGLSLRNINVLYNASSTSLPVLLSTLYNYAYLLRGDAHPPLFYLLNALALHLHHSLITIRLFTLLCSILSILFLYLFAKRIFSPSLALFATALYAIHPMHIIFSQHIRPYILLFLFFNASLYFHYRYLQEKKMLFLVPLIAMFTLSFYTHYYTLLYIIAATLVTIIVFRTDPKHRLLPFFIGLLIFFLLSIPNLVLLHQRISEYPKNPNHQITNVASLTVLPYPLYKFSLMSDVSTTLTVFPPLLLLFPLLLILAFFGAFRLYQHARTKAFFLITHFSIPYIILACTGLFLTLFSFRYLTFLLPIYILLISYGLSCIKKSSIRIFLTLCICISWFLVTLYYYSILTTHHWAIFIAI